MTNLLETMSLKRMYMILKNMLHLYYQQAVLFCHRCMHTLSRRYAKQTIAHAHIHTCIHYLFVLFLQNTRSSLTLLPKEHLPRMKSCNCNREIVYWVSNIDYLGRKQPSSRAQNGHFGCSLSSSSSDSCFL